MCTDKHASVHRLVHTFLVKQWPVGHAAGFKVNKLVEGILSSIRDQRTKQGTAGKL